MAKEERYEKVQREKIRQTKRETKPSARRGYKRKYTKGVGWESVPRSGFFSAFLSTFSLFLVILVLFNVVMGTGYTGYKTAVQGLYVATTGISSLATSVMDFVKFAGSIIVPVTGKISGWINESQTSLYEQALITGDIYTYRIYGKTEYRVVIAYYSPLPKDENGEPLFVFNITNPAWRGYQIIYCEKNNVNIERSKFTIWGKFNEVTIQGSHNKYEFEYLFKGDFRTEQKGD